MLSGNYGSWAGGKTAWPRNIQGGNSSIGRASAFQAGGCGFESRFPLHSCFSPFTFPANERSLAIREIWA